MALDGQVQTASWHSYFNVWETDTGGQSTDKYGTNTLYRNITHKTNGTMLQPRITDLIPNLFSVNFTLCNLLSHQTRIIHMVNGHHENFMPAPMEIPTKLKAVLGFRALEFRTTHSFIHYKFTPNPYFVYRIWTFVHSSQTNIVRYCTVAL